MKEPLKGKVTLVTGAGGGIGTKICEKFAELGSFVYLCDVQGTTDLANLINKKYKEPRSKPAPCDISSKEDVKAMYRQISDERDGVDILINNAAVYGPLEVHHFPQISYEDFVKTVNIDLSGAVYCTLMALPYMKEKKWGKIIFSAAPLSSTGNVEEDLLSITSVHPMREEAVSEFLARTGFDWSVVQRLITQDKLIEMEYEGMKFYMRRLH